jgi:anti-sigma factor RsiW
MKDFESTFNRWLDGSLNEAERREFEASLDEEALHAAKSWPGIRTLLKESAAQIALPHPDFLNEQVRRAIEEKPSLPAFPLSRLVWAGSFCVVAAVALTLCFLPIQNHGSTVVFVAGTSVPGASASTFQPPGERGAVIWLDGMPYIPDGERVQ